MQQVLIIDQRAMAMQAMANLVEQIAQIDAFVNKKPEMNRAGMRRFEAKMKPLRLRLARLRVKQKQMQENIEKFNELLEQEKASENA